MEEAEKDFTVRSELRGSIKMLNSLTLYVTGLSTGFVLNNAAVTQKFEWKDSWPFLVAGGLYAMGKTFVEISQAKKRRV
ncbi:hypothetical protein [Spirosoma areae]